MRPAPRNVGVRRSDTSATRWAAEIVVAAAGATLVVCAIAANQRWLDRHFLPSWFLARHWYVLIESFARLLMGAVGLLLVALVRPRAGRLVAREPARIVSVLVAVVLAFGAGELVLRHVHLRAAEWLLPEEEPRRQSDPQLGWTFVPSRTGRSTVGGRAIEYAFDAAGYRVRRVDEPVDPDRPAILFVGESVMFGEGLTWEETVPATVGTMMGIQSANLAVHGFATDQAYLRLETELPRFRQPVAVVSLFMTPLFGRNLDDDRPHLGPGLVWLPPAQHGRLASLAKLLVPYRSDATVARGIQVTREVLAATIKLTRARGAIPLIIVPHFGGEAEVERTLRQRVLDEAGLPYVWVQIADDWRLPWDRHPNPRAASAIATSIADRLRAQ
jgi:hypothetical protein